MNEQERILAVLNGGLPDKTPWFADLSYWIFSLQERGLLPEEYQGEGGYIAFHRDQGAGACFEYNAVLWDITYSGGVRYTEKVEGDVKTCVFDTPSGSLTSRQKYLKTSFSWAYTEHFVKDFDDLKRMLYVHEHTEFKANYDTFDRISALWGGDGLLAATPVICAAPLQKLLSRWAGVEATVSLVYEDDETFGKINEDIQRTEDAVFDILAASGAKYVEFAENLSSEVTGRAFFERFNQGYYERRTRQLHRAGKFCGIHIDGTLAPCLGMLKGCGFDVAEGITPAPVGTVAPERLRELAGDGIVLWGGLPGPIFTGLFSDEQFEAYVSRVLALFPPGSGFVLGVGDQVPPDCAPGRVKRVRDIVDSHAGCSCFQKG